MELHLSGSNCIQENGSPVSYRPQMQSVLPLKKIENPRLGNKKPKKTQGQISIRFRKIFGKNRTFPEKKQTFPEEMSFYPPKFSDDFFFSHHT